MSAPPYDDTAFRRGFAHALREMQRGLALAAAQGLSAAQVAEALAQYQRAVEEWRRLPADRYIEQPAFRPGTPPDASSEER